MNWKSNRNKFGSVLSTKIIGAIELEEVEFFEFPKENLPKESLRQNFYRKYVNLGENFITEKSTKTQLGIIS